MRLAQKLGAALAVVSALGNTAQAQVPVPVPVKVMIVSMFGPEGDAWLSKREMKQTVAVPGLSPDYPAVHCGADAVCHVTTGMGYATASASIAALVYSSQFDLRHT